MWKALSQLPPAAHWLYWWGAEDACSMFLMEQLIKDRSAGEEGVSKIMQTLLTASHTIIAFVRGVEVDQRYNLMERMS